MLRRLHDVVVPFFLEEADIHLYFTTSEPTQLEIFIRDTEFIRGEYRGMAWVSTNYAEVAYDYTHWLVSFAHELGHLLRLGHNIYTFMHPQVEVAARQMLVSPLEREIMQENVREIRPRGIVVRGIQAILRLLRENFYGV